MNSLLHVAGVYKILCKVTNKFYIGSSNNIHHRWIVHRSELNTNKHKNKYLQNAWNKYGRVSFTIEIVEIVEDVSMLLEREQYYLDTLKPFNGIGYNIGIKSSSGLSGRKLSDEHKRKLSVAKKGKPMSEAQKVLVREFMTGSKRSPETVEKIRVALSNRVIKDETRAKLSRYRIGKPMSDVSKDKLAKDYVVTDPKGNEYQVRNLKRFCNEHGLNYKIIAGLVKRASANKAGWKCRKVE